MEEVLSELKEEEEHSSHNNPNNSLLGLPPGFRFHPTDDELVTFYLLSKAFHHSSHPFSSPFLFAEVDLCRCEPWDLPDAAKMGEREWYFYSLRDRKHPTRVRTNRATAAGYWKATGKDREVYSAVDKSIVGLKKTLVFYQGRAPRGLKTRWVMHEYRLHACFYMSKFTPTPPCLLLKEWVMCRIHLRVGEKGKIISGAVREKGEEEEEEERVLFIPEMETTQPCTREGFVEEDGGGGGVGGWWLEDGFMWTPSFWNGYDAPLLL